MNFHRDPVKDIKIRQDSGRNGVGFDDVVDIIESGKFLDIILNPDQVKYPGQNIFIIEIQGYVYHIPYRMNGNDCYLITIYPSRKSTKKYL